MIVDRETRIAIESLRGQIAGLVAGVRGPAGATGPAGAAVTTTWAGITDKPAYATQAATASLPGYLLAADFTTFAAKQAAITTGTTAQYLKGDLSLGTFAHAASHGSGQADAVTVAQSQVTDLGTALAGKQAAITTGTTAQYLKGDLSLGTLNQAAVAGLTTADSPTFAGLAISAGPVGLKRATPAYLLHAGGTAAADGIRSDMGFDINPVANTAAPTVALLPAEAGNVTTGAHKYAVTYVTAYGETAAPNVTSITTDASHGKVTVTLPVSTDSRVTGRRVYRTLASNAYDLRLVATIADTSTTSYVDNIADASLGATNNYLRANTTSAYLTMRGVTAAQLDTNRVTFGQRAGNSVTTGGSLTLIGTDCGKAITSAQAVTAVGYESMLFQASGSRTSTYGYRAGYNLTSSTDDVIVGANAMLSVVVSSTNTAVGAGTGGGSGTHNKSGCVFLGYQAGYAETASNKLYIHNGSATTPLIYGEFDGGLRVQSQAAAKIALTVKGAASQSASLQEWHDSTGAVIGSMSIGGVLLATTAAVTGVKSDTAAATDLTITTGAAKTLVLATPTYNDINTGINPRNTGAGRPTLATMTGDINEFQFAVNDFADLAPIELLHDWKEGTAVEIHCHWATGSLNDATVRGVKWEIDYCYADMGGVMTAAAATSVETSIAANAAALTHKYTSIATFTPTGYKIGAQLCMHIKRIASVTNTAPADNPFLLSVGIHYQQDTMGSRTISTK